MQSLVQNSAGRGAESQEDDHEGEYQQGACVGAVVNRGAVQRADASRLGASRSGGKPWGGARGAGWGRIGDEWCAPSTGSVGSWGGKAACANGHDEGQRAKHCL